MELNLSERKAKQLGCWEALSQAEVETGGNLTMGVTYR